MWTSPLRAKKLEPRGHGKAWFLSLPQAAVSVDSHALPFHDNVSSECIFNVRQESPLVVIGRPQPPCFISVWKIWQCSWLLTLLHAQNAQLMPVSSAVSRCPTSMSSASTALQSKSGMLKISDTNQYLPMHVFLDTAPHE